MAHLLNKNMNDLTEAEKQSIIKLSKLLQSKPSKPFSSVTLTDIKRVDGLGLKLQHIEPHIATTTLHMPANIPSPTPSFNLCENLKRIDSTWALNTEMACRTIIDAIIIECLYESQTDLIGFCEVNNSWSGTGFGYTGTVDYMIGSSVSRDTADNLDSFFLVVQAKTEWPKSALPQVLAEAGCLLNKRLAAGKQTPVFAVLTNAKFFQFFAIDTDSIVYCSGEPTILAVGPDGSWNASTSLVDILRWFRWFITCMASISPRASRVDITQTMERALADVINCFGKK
ncbi:hypothetical protein SeLEV6574_g08586 [Synchytrium endobioticum]|uniref:Uncharacterized protein n=1 Tax=Synchytrium endobioticum TaxID=286115 RepID=A0A507BYI6_9FUNG|nr:hypothetical protein SeLEV6574_g08586 [Synchytrium endobioticum]